MLLPMPVDCGVEFGYSVVDLEEGQAGSAHLSSLWSDNQILDPP